jgi:non-ribosomal peptide synthetase component F
MIENAAQMRPSSPAIRAWDRDFSYKELKETTSRLAQALVCRGVKQEQLVPICFEKSSWTIVAMIATLKAGGGFVLLDPAVPQERLKRIAKGVGAALVLCSAKHSSTVEAFAKENFIVNESALSRLQDLSSALPKTKCSLCRFHFRNDRYS